MAMRQKGLLWGVFIDGVLFMGLFSVMDIGWDWISFDRYICIWLGRPEHNVIWVEVLYETAYYNSYCRRDCMIVTGFVIRELSRLRGMPSSLHPQ
jgi:hypothetical protein